MTGRVHRIKNWKGCFEVSQNGACKTWSWIAVPIKHDGKSYRRLMGLPNGPAIYGAWILIAAVAAKCEPRGTLLDDGVPLTAEDLHFKTGAPEALFVEAIEALVSERIGWLELVEIEHAQEPLEHAPAELETQYGTGQNGTVRDITKTGRPESRPTEGIDFEKLPDWPELAALKQRNVKPLNLVELQESLKSKLKGKRAFEPLEEAWLRNTNDLAGWFQWQLTLSRPVLASSVAGFLVAICAAEHALAIPKSAVKRSRVGAFATAISQHKWADLRERLPLAVERLERWEAAT